MEDSKIHRFTKDFQNVVYIEPSLYRWPSKRPQSILRPLNSKKKFVQGFFKRFSPYRRLSKDVLPIKALTNLFKGFLCEDGLQKVFSPIRKSLKVLLCKDDLQIEGWHRVEDEDGLQNVFSPIKKSPSNRSLTQSFSCTEIEHLPCTFPSNAAKKAINIVVEFYINCFLATTILFEINFEKKKRKIVLFWLECSVFLIKLILLL